MLQQLSMLFPAQHVYCDENITVTFFNTKLHHVRLLGDDVKLVHKHTLGYLL